MTAKSGLLQPTLQETGSNVAEGKYVNKPNSTTPDGFSQAMAAVLSGFFALSSAGLSPWIAFVLPAVVVVVIAALR